jgi:hypothetical protein
LPVLAWLAAGLRSGLPPAATQQAHELACALLGVMTQVLHDGVVQLLMNDPLPDKPLVTSVQRAVEPLGSQGKLQCYCHSHLVCRGIRSVSFAISTQRSKRIDSGTMQHSVWTCMVGKQL